MSSQVTLRSIAVFVALTLLACRDHKQTPGQAGSAAVPPAAGDRIAEFWKWFADHAAALRTEPDLTQTMLRIGAELEKVNDGLIAEIAKGADTLTLVLSADGHEELFPIVQQVYARRPHVEGWAIVAFRPRGDLSSRIELGDRSIDPSQVKFVATRAGAKLDIDVYIPGYTTNEDMGSLAFVFLDHVVGEYDMETKIGGIEFASITQAPPDAKPIAALPAAVDALE